MSSHHHDIYIHLLYSIAREKSKKYTLFSLYRLTIFFFVLWYCLRIQKKHSSWLCFLCFFHKLLNKLVCNLFHSRQILDWIFWQTIQFFDFLFVHYKIQSKSKLKTMHNVMKNIEQNMIHQYIKHHKHHQIVSFILANFYDIKLLFMILWSHFRNKFRFFLNMSDICEFFTHINFFKSFVDVSIFVIFHNIHALCQWAVC